VSVIYGGVDYEFWSAQEAQPSRFREKYGLGDRFVYCAFGRAGISKGFQYLIEAAKRVAQVMPSSRLFLVLNEGELKSALIEMVRSSSVLSEHIVLESALTREGLRDAIAGSDLAVVPSLSEGFGFSVAEACAVGTPVVATKAGSIPEVISGRHLLVPPGDPAELANAILRGASGDWDYLPRKRFDWEETARRYEEVFRQILGAARYLRK